MKNRSRLRGGLAKGERQDKRRKFKRVNIFDILSIKE
jgi:hypothetical protein